MMGCLGGSDLHQVDRLHGYAVPTFMRLCHVAADAWTKMQRYCNACCQSLQSAPMLPVLCLHGACACAVPAGGCAGAEADADVRIQHTTCIGLYTLKEAEAPSSGGSWMEKAS
jgi:hypothetical protein